MVSELYFFQDTIGEYKDRTGPIERILKEGSRVVSVQDGCVLFLSMLNGQ